MSKTHLILNCVLLFILLPAGCGNVSNKLDRYFAAYDYSKSGYHLNDPDKSYPLPYELLEISGLTLIDENNLGAVQDEKGTFFVFNVLSGEVIRTIRFHGNGDFEAVEKVGDEVFAMKSNGRVYKFTYGDDNEIEAESFSTRLSSRNDVEGLGYHDKEEKMMIALKGSAEVNENKAKGKAIYSLNTSSIKSSKEPYFNFKKKQIKPYFEAKGRSWSDSYHFKPSGIAQHPINKNFYIICNVGKILIICDPDGDLQDVFHLNPLIYRQPEGICFDSKGTLYISNEGKGRRANILSFKYEE